MVAPRQAVVHFGNTFANTTPASFGSTTTAGDTIFVAGYADGGHSIASISDDATPSNTYAAAAVDSGATTFAPTNAELWYSTTTRAATTVTVTWSANTTHGDIVIADYPPPASGNWTLVSPSGSNHAHTTSNAYGAGPASGNFSNAAVGDLLIGFPLCSGLNTPETNWTARATAPYYWEDFTATGVSSSNNATASGGFQGWIALGAAFTPSAVAGPVTGPGIAPSDRDPRLPSLALALRDLPQPGKGSQRAVPINYAAQQQTWGPTITPAYRVPWLPKLCAQQLPMLGKSPLIAPPGNPRPLAVLILGQANTVDPLNVARALTLPVSATSIVAVTLQASRALSLAVAGAASLGVTLKVARALAVAIVGSAAVVATMKVARGLIVAIVGRAIITAAANVARPLAVAIVGSAVVTFPLKVARALAVAILGAATVTDTMAVARACIVAIRGQATVAGAVSVARGLVMATLGRASVSTPLSASRALVMGVHGAATMADVLSVARAFVLAIHGHVAAGFDNGGTVQLAIGILGRANMTGALSVQRNLAIGVLARAVVAEQVAIARALGLRVQGYGGLIANLSVSIPFSAPLCLHADSAPLLVLTPDMRPILVLEDSAAPLLQLKPDSKVCGS